MATKILSCLAYAKQQLSPTIPMAYPAKGARVAVGRKKDCLQTINNGVSCKGGTRRSGKEERLFTDDQQCNSVTRCFTTVAHQGKAGVHHTCSQRGHTSGQPCTQVQISFVSGVLQKRR